MANDSSVLMRHGDLKDPDNTRKPREISVPRRTAKVLEKSGWTPVEGKGSASGDSAKASTTAASAADKKDS